MKKSILIASLVAISGLMTAPLAVADPSTIVYSFTCPGISGSSHVLSNFGSKIAGYGTENISSNPSNPNQPYFSWFITSGAHIPAKLTTYSSSETDYDPTTSTVSCSYTSSSSTNDPFTVSYFIENAFGGSIDESNHTASSITINGATGFKG